MARGAINSHKITEGQYISCFGNSTEKYFWICWVHRGGEAKLPQGGGRFSWCATGGSRWRRWRGRRRREEHFAARTPFADSTPRPCGSPSAKAWNRIQLYSSLNVFSLIKTEIYLHLCYLVLCWSRLFLLLSSFKFHLPGRNYEVPFFGSQKPPFPLLQLLLSEDDLVGWLVCRPEHRYPLLIVDHEKS